MTNEIMLHAEWDPDAQSVIVTASLGDLESTLSMTEVALETFSEKTLDEFFAALPAAFAQGIELLIEKADDLIAQKEADERE